MVVLLMVISVQAQGFDREPNEKKPPVQGAVVNKMPARATAITPTESQMWWGYFSESDRADSQYGYNKAVTIDAFICIPAGTEMVSNSVIKAIRIWFSQDVTKVSDCKIWISRTLPESMDVIDYSQQVSVASLADGVNEIVLNTPFAVNSTDLYIGYTVSITGQAYLVNVSDNATPNAFFYRNSNDGVIRHYYQRLFVNGREDDGDNPTCVQRQGKSEHRFRL